MLDIKLLGIDMAKIVMSLMQMVMVFLDSCGMQYHTSPKNIIYMTFVFRDLDTNTNTRKSWCICVSWASLFLICTHFLSVLECFQFSIS